MDEPTPWEDINPPMVSAPRHEPLSRCSDAEDRTVFRNELTACLALVAPVGMTEEARRDWLAVAWDTLKEIPPDILKLAAKAARTKADHPAKVVPIIFAEARERMGWRASLNAALPQFDDPLRIPGPPHCTPEEAREILEEFGLKRDWSE